MNIYSKASYPANKLSNFTSFKFIFDKVECSSMEGLLQAFKFEDKNSQSITCSLSGMSAKQKGSGRNKIWKSKQTLWWAGKSFKRKSKEYQVLLDQAYNALYTNENFKKALLSSGKKTVFTHSIGRSNKKETILTKSEFCKRLQYLKDYGEIPINEKYQVIGLNDEEDKNLC